jgi:hypothetical protein
VLAVALAVEVLRAEGGLAPKPNDLSGVGVSRGLERIDLRVGHRGVEG